jgi:hypothetical protein
VEALLVACFLLVVYLTYSLTPKMEAVHSSILSANFYQTTWHHIPEDSTVLSMFLFYCFSHQHIAEQGLLSSVGRIFVSLVSDQQHNWQVMIK